MKYIKRIDYSGKTLTVESYSHDLPVSGGIVIEKAEFDAFISNLPTTKPPPIRNVFKELDDLKIRIEKLENL